MSRQLRLPVPTHIVTGALNSGKTSGILHWLASKPPEEVWAVIVNEWGAVGIDAAALDAHANVTVRQLAGGCMCCVTTGVLTAALAQIIRNVKPDRLIIEPSGLGHPAGLIDVLQGEHLRTALRLHAVVCLVDLQRDPQALMTEPVFADQVNVADVLAGSKADAAAPGAADAFTAWASTLFPPKHVLTFSHGQLPAELWHAERDAAQLALLSGRAGARRTAQQQARAAAGAAAAPPPAIAPAAAAVASGPSAAAAGAAASDGEPLPGRPARFVREAQPGGGLGSARYVSSGWLFSEQDLFDPGRLLDTLQQLALLAARVKGVFRTGSKQWVMPVASGVAGAAAGPRTAVPAGPPSAAGQAQQQPSQAQQAATASSASASACQLVLQPVAYRGLHSMVEVIVACDASPGGAAASQLADAVAQASLGSWDTLQACLVSALAAP